MFDIKRLKKIIKRNLNRIKAIRKDHDAIPVGIIGLGRWGAQYINLLMGSRYFKLIAAYDLNVERLYDLAKTNGFKVANSSAELIRDHGVRAIFILTPSHLHYQDFKMVYDLGIDVYMEKPIAVEVSEAELMTQYANKSNIKLYVAHSMKMSSLFIRIKEEIARNTIGTVHMFQCNRSTGKALEKDDKTWRNDIRYAPLVPMLQLGIHYIDLVHFLFGDILSSKSFGIRDVTQSENVDAITTIVACNGIIGTICCSYATENTFDMEIYGTEGKLIISNSSLEIIKKGKKTMLLKNSKKENILEIEINEFYRWVVLNEKPINTGENALKALKVFDQIRKNISLCEDVF